MNMVPPVSVETLSSVGDMSLPEGPLVYGIFTPQCFYKIFVQHTFSDLDCAKFIVSKLLGYAIIAGSFFLKLPQILKIVKAGSVVGLTPASFYLEVLMFEATSIYNVLQEYPISTWGENLVILIQNLVLVLLLWLYKRPVVATSEKLLMTFLFFVLGVAMMALPSEYRWIIASSSIPISCAARIPQIIDNFSQGHTGQLAIITVLLNFGGSLARSFTTYQETQDMVQIIGYSISILLNGMLLLQILFFWKATNLVCSKKDKKTKTNKEKES